MKTQQSQINKLQLLYKTVLFFSTYLQISDATSQSIALKAGVPLNIPIDLTKLTEINDIAGVSIKYLPQQLEGIGLNLYPKLIGEYVGQKTYPYNLLIAKKLSSELFSKGIYLSDKNFKTIFLIEGELKWQQKFSVNLATQPTIASDGTLYCGAVNGNLYAINPNGSIKWVFQTEHQHSVVIWYTSIVLSEEGTAYFGGHTDDRSIYAVSSNGNLKWKRKTNADTIQSSPCIANDGTIYIGTMNECYLNAINPDGSLKWRYYTNGGYVITAPTIANDGTVYITAYNYLYAINPNGILKWRYFTGAGDQYLPPVIAGDGTIYVSPSYYSSLLYAINSDGSLKWRYDSVTVIYWSPLIAADGTVYIGSADGNLHSIYPNGTLKWIQPKAGAGLTAIGIDGSIYTTSGLVLSSLDSKGKKKWQYPADSNISAGLSPASITKDGTIYIISKDVLYAINSNYFSTTDPWPKFHQNNRNTGAQVSEDMQIFDTRYLTLDGTPNVTGIITIEVIVNQSIVYVTLNFSTVLLSIPILTNNKLTIRNGKVLVLTTKNFNASDVDRDYHDLLYKIVALRHGWFTYINNSNTEILSFSQKNIVDGLIQFNHDGSKFTPHYNVTVTNGVLTTPSVAAQVVFDPAPVLSNNLLIITQGQSLVLNLNMLKASYPDEYTIDLSLNFAISDLQHGYFESTIKPGVSITSFTQQELLDGKIKFTHDDSEFESFYKVSITDGSIITTPVSMNITFIRVPLITNNFLIINQGETLLINNNMLRSSSEQTNNSSDLIFTVSEIKHGHFELITNFEAITTFSQQQINDGQILFVHDGTDTAPSYKVRVSDKNLISKEKEVIVRFNVGSNNAVNIAAIVGGTLGGSIVSLALASVVLFLYNKKYSTSTLEQPKKTLNPLATIESDASIKSEQVFPVLIDQTNEATPALSQNLQLSQEQQLLRTDDAKSRKLKFDCVQTVINEQDIEFTHKRSIFIPNTPNDSPNNSGNPLSIKFSEFTGKQSIEGFSKDFGFNKKSIFLVETIDEPITTEPVLTVLIDQTNEKNSALSQNFQFNQEQQSLPDDKANKTKFVKNVTQHKKTLSL